MYSTLVYNILIPVLLFSLSTTVSDIYVAVCAGCDCFMLMNYLNSFLFYKVPQVLLEFEVFLDTFVFYCFLKCGVPLYKLNYKQSIMFSLLNVCFSKYVCRKVNTCYKVICMSKIFNNYCGTDKQHI